MSRSLLVKFYVLLRLLIRRLAFRRLPSLHFGKCVSYDLFTEFEGYNQIGDQVDVSSSKIGRGTYLGNFCCIRNSKIGRFCSLADNVRMGIGTHPTRQFVSTHPAFFSPIGQSGFTFVKECHFEELPKASVEGTITNYSVIVGNDVWIGSGVRIMDGVNIGDGAIIGAGAVVTKDVEPYGIYTGVPARLRRMRFESNEIEYLQAFNWWNRDMDWLRANSKIFLDIEKLMSDFPDVQ